MKANLGRVNWPSKWSLYLSLPWHFVLTGTNLGLSAHVYECLGDHRVCRVALLNLHFSDDDDDDDDDDANQESCWSPQARGWWGRRRDRRSQRWKDIRGPPSRCPEICQHKYESLGSEEWSDRLPECHREEDDAHRWEGEAQFGHLQVCKSKHCHPLPCS